MDDPGAWMIQAAQVGAAAVFAKDVQPDELKSALRRLARGERLVHGAALAKPHVAARVLKEYRELAQPRKPPSPGVAALSQREIEVLAFIARGSSNKEIARALKISDQTVKNHMTSILRKLGVNDRTQAVVYALRRGWIKL
jgi:DNA-binding NarL/FixJ family response regulator